MGMTRAQERDVRALLYQEQQAKKQSEFARLREAHNHVGHRVTVRDKEGNGGEVTMLIPPTLYHECGNYYGYECWQDPDFCDFAMNRWPEIRVHNENGTPRIVVPATVAPLASKPKKFSKTYETAEVAA